jgi:hypothetical protein
VLPNKKINKTKGNEDENIVLAEIGGDESVDNDDEIGGYEKEGKRPNQISIKFNTTQIEGSTL